jgi:hypothetical protein
VLLLLKKIPFWADKRLMQLFLAYTFALVLIAGLVLLARRNQNQGWRKKRGVIGGIQLETHTDTMQPYTSQLEHLGDITRLRQALVAHSEPLSEEPVEAITKEDLATIHRT